MIYSCGCAHAVYRIRVRSRRTNFFIVVDWLIYYVGCTGFLGERLWVGVLGCKNGGKESPLAAKLWRSFPAPSYDK